MWDDNHLAFLTHLKRWVYPANNQMKRISFDLPEDLLLNLEDFVGLRIYNSADLELAISILLQKRVNQRRL